MRVYLAKGDVRGSMIPNPFEKLPPLPCTVRLAPGTYTAEAESPNASTGHERFAVEHDAPIKVDVRSGNASVKSFGGVFIGLGIVSTILGIVEHHLDLTQRRQLQPVGGGPAAHAGRPGRGRAGDWDDLPRLDRDRRAAPRAGRTREGRRAQPQVLSFGERATRGARKHVATWSLTSPHACIIA